jgi:hypothetical protein
MKITYIMSSTVVKLGKSLLKNNTKFRAPKLNLVLNSCFDNVFRPENHKDESKTITYFINKKLKDGGFNDLTIKFNKKYDTKIKGGSKLSKTVRKKQDFPVFGYSDMEDGFINQPFGANSSPDIFVIENHVVYYLELKTSSNSNNPKLNTHNLNPNYIYLYSLVDKTYPILGNVITNKEKHMSINFIWAFIRFKMEGSVIHDTNIKIYERLDNIYTDTKFLKQYFENNLSVNLDDMKHYDLKKWDEITFEELKIAKDENLYFNKWLSNHLLKTLPLIPNNFNLLSEN